MYIIRRAKADDATTLLKMAKMVHFINLPASKQIISDKIAQSRQSFLRAAGNDKAAPRKKVYANDGGIAEKTAAAELFMFVLEDLSSPGCLGTSQIVSQMGGAGNPNVCFKLEEREKYSTSLKFGTKNIVARVFLDESGPTELGGLIMQPSFRGHPLKLGRFVSLVRFHFLALHREIFRPTILAEMMAPITPEGDNLLWDYLGRRFIPLSYTEADEFCQHSREFMTSLLPEGDIHLSLLPPEARALVGEVGPETVPARRMLEKLGFTFTGMVDPFDGGPYLLAKTDEIQIVKDTRAATFGAPVAHAKTDKRGIVSTLDSDGEFRAVQCAFALDRQRRVCVTRDVMQALQVSAGDYAGYTPIAVPVTPGRGKQSIEAETRAAKATKKTTKKKAAKRTATKPVSKKTAKKTTKKTTKKTGKKTAKKPARARR